MTVILLLIPLALVLAGAALVAFLWGVRSGQFDDLETPARRMLHDEERERSPRRRESRRA